MVYATRGGFRIVPPRLESETFGRDRFVLRACAYRQRTESGAPDHCRLSSTQSGRIGVYHLRVDGMAPAQRETEESRVRGVAAEVAAADASRSARVARHQTTRRSSPPGHRSAQRSPVTLARTIARLPACTHPVNRRSRRPPSFPAVYSALPSTGISGPLWRTTALLGIHSVAGRAGLPAIHQCRLEDGAARYLDRMERPGTPGQPSPNYQQRTLPDPAMGRSAAFGQSHSVFSSPSNRQLFRIFSMAQRGRKIALRRSPSSQCAWVFEESTRPTRGDITSKLE